MARRRRAPALLGGGNAAALCACASLAAGAAHAQSAEDLQSFSISELANLEVSSATKTPESLSDAPAALYVINHDDIVRSGAVNLPEILRLAPNLFVAQTGAHSWVITARGMSGNASAQSFANKLLVLIDGRSVYDPLFSGVDWLDLDVVPEDIDRIEVISGPGATLWGANAVNGVINIITKASYRTQGTFVDVTAGTQESSATVRTGGRLSDDLTWRVYARDFAIGDTVTSAGTSADDHWYKPQGGFRLDWTPGAADAVTFEGDGFVGQTAEPGAPDANFNGFNVNASWDHRWSDGGDLQVQGYINREQAGPTPSGVPVWFTTYDLEAQDNFALGARQAIVVGAGVRDTLYRVTDTPTFFWRPASRALRLSDAFAQDTFILARGLDLILGLKLENDPFSGISPLPSVRLSWSAAARLLLWASVQKAIRAPTPFDTDPRELLGSFLFLKGNPDFLPEKLTAYETGLRAQPWAGVSFSIQGFYNDYDQLRTVEFGPEGFPLTWGNGLHGHSYGLEAWGDLQAARWWRLSAGLDLLSEKLAFDPGASGLLGVAQAGDDPPAQAQLRSAMNLGRSVTLDAGLRYVGALPNPRVPAYAEMDASLMWALSRRLQLGVAGFNLLHARHLEFPASGGATEVPRTGQVELRARF
jgi:iron complex outermembrane receptor protein